MYYLVSVDHNGMVAHLTRSDLSWSNVVDEMNGNMLWNDSEEAGNARSECEEDDGTDCEDGQNGESDTDW
jgi:hypothetical protein